MCFANRAQASTTLRPWASHWSAATRPSNSFFTVSALFLAPGPMGFVGSVILRKVPDGRGIREPGQSQVEPDLMGPAVIGGGQNHLCEACTGEIRLQVLGLGRTRTSSSYIRCEACARSTPQIRARSGRRTQSKCSRFYRTANFPHPISDALARNIRQSAVIPGRAELSQRTLELRASFQLLGAQVVKGNRLLQGKRNHISPFSASKGELILLLRP